MHLTFDQWAKLGSLASALAGFYTFLHVVYRRMVKPLFVKIMSAVEDEKKFRQDIRATIVTVNEFKEFFDAVKSEVSDLVDLIQWASAMRTYADVRVVPKGGVKAKGKAVGSEKEPNGGLS